MTSSSKRVALVTGGSRGIGLGIAESLASSGFDLAIKGIRDEEQVADSMQLLRDLGAVAHYFRVDVSVAEDRQQILAGVRSRFSRLDVLVNNAGVAPKVRADIFEASEESFDRVLGINLKGPYFLTQLAARWMIEQRRASSDFHGVIVNISSVSATEASTNRRHFCLRKGGISKANAALGQWLWEFGIAVY